MREIGMMKASTLNNLRVMEGPKAVLLPGMSKSTDPDPTR